MVYFGNGVVGFFTKEFSSSRDCCQICFFLGVCVCGRGGGLGGFMACQDYFTHVVLRQSLGGAKRGNSQEKTPDHLQAELWLVSHDPS